MTRRALVLAVLVYVGLDLSLADMPGAFVFEPTDSVESAHGIRSQGVRPFVAVQPPGGDRPMAVSPPPAPLLSLAVAIGIPAVLRLACRLPRAVLAPAPSEDSH